MKYIHFLLPCFLFFLSANLQAAGFQSGESITLDSIVNEDSYIACKSLTVHKAVKGDLIAAAQTIIINDTIGGDLSAAGESVWITSFVADDIRAFCKIFTIKGNVKGDVILFSSEAFIQQGTVIEGDLVVYSGNVTVAGTVKGNIIIKGGNVHLLGVCEGEADVKAETLTADGIIGGPAMLSAQKINIGNAKFSGQVKYWQQSGRINADNTKFPAGLIYDPSLAWENGNKDKAMWFVGFGFLLWHLLFGLLLIGLLLLIFPSWFSNAAANIATEPMKSFGYGILYFIATPFIAVFLMMTFIALPLGIMLMVFYIFTLLSGLIITSLVMAWFIKIKYGRRWNRWSVAGISMLIMIALHIILMIPFLGFLFTILLVAAAFGAMLMKSKRQETIDNMNGL